MKKKPTIKLDCSIGFEPARMRFSSDKLADIWIELHRCPFREEKQDRLYDLLTDLIAADAAVIGYTTKLSQRK